MEHDGDDDDNNEGIHKPGGREPAISSVRLPRACVRVLRGRAGDEAEKKRRRSLSKQQSREETRCRGCGGRRDWIPEGRVINPRAKYAKIPAGEFITWLRRGSVCGTRGFLLPIFRPRGLPSGAYIYIYNEK